VNWIPVIAEQPGTTSPILLRGVPGYAPVYSPLQTAGLPVRGGYDADGFGVVVIGQRLYKFDATDNLLDLGTIPGIQRVSFSHNQVAGGVQIAIANGTGGYVYDTSNSTFQQITDDAFPGARTFGYLDSYIIGVEPGGNYWFVSALADATSYSTLDRYQAESEPDRIMTALVSHSDVVILGARTTEFWFDAGTQTDTFQRRDGTGFEIGCSSSFAAVNLDNTVYWRGNDGSAYRLAGYTPERISTGPVEQAWARCDPSQCYAMTYVDRGHKIVYFTHPDGETFGFDAATQLWHRRQSYRMNRWRPSCLFNYSGKWYAGDFTNGSIALLDWGWNTENGQPLIAERSTTVIQDDRNRFRLNAVEVLFDSQKSKPSTSLLSIAGDLPNGYVNDTIDFKYVVSATLLPAAVSITSGALPTGTTMDNKGHVTGQVTAGGTYTWTATVTDAKGNTAHVDDSANFTIVQAAQLSDWKYLQVDDSDNTDRSAVDFDDSSWSTGTAPFGAWYDGTTTLPAAHSYNAAFSATFATTWNVDTRLWLRRTLSLTVVPVNGIKITYYMDDHFSLYVNGKGVFDSADNPSGGTGSTFVVAAPNLVEGDNCIAILCHDEEPPEDGSVTYFDMFMEGA
jgi:hypothetical protein